MFIALVETASAYVRLRYDNDRNMGNFAGAKMALLRSSKRNAKRS
jgi:hypothetical protein